MSWVGHVARMEEKRGVSSVLVGKPEGKGPLGRPRLRWEFNLLEPEFYIQILAHTVGKMRIIQEPKKVAL